MPQFDTFIFSSSLFYFIIFFLLFLIYNYIRVLPRISAILKLRSKFVKRSSVSNANIKLFKMTQYIFLSENIIDTKN